MFGSISAWLFDLFGDSARLSEGDLRSSYSKGTLSYDQIICNSDVGRNPFVVEEPDHCFSVPECSLADL